MEVLRYGYRIPFLRDPPLSKVPIPMPSYHPLSTKGVALGEVTQALIAKSAVELAPLPSLGFYSHLFVVWKTSGSWRSVIDLSTLNLFLDVSHFKMETIQSVLLSVRQGDWMASIDLKEAYLQIPVHPESCRFLRFVAQGQVYQFTALCFGLSTAPQVFSRVMALVPRRLARPVVLTRLSHQRPSGGPRPLLGAGHRRQPREVSPRTLSGGSVSRGGDRCPVFQGFSVAGSHCQAAINSWRIFVLRRSSSQYLALAAGNAVLLLPSRSGRTPPGEVTPAVPPPILGSSGSVHLDPLVSGLPQGSQVVASRPPSIVRGVSSAGVSGSGLLVRRLGRRLGSSLGLAHRFRPLEPQGMSSLHQRQGTFSSSQGSPPLPVISDGENYFSILRQQHSGVLPPQGRRHEVPRPQFSGAGDSPLGRVLLHPPDSPVHPGVSQCAGGLSISPSPATTYRVVPQSGGLSIYKSSVAGPNRLICNLRESPMLHLALLGSDGSGHRRVPSTLGRSSGLCVSSLVYHSQSSGETPGISGDRAHLGGSVLASATMVSRPPSPVAGPSGYSTSTSRPPAPASVSQPLPGSPQAAASCLERLRRFTRAAGFSSTVASQASLSRRSSSRKAYQLKWQVYRAWCRSHGHLVSRPSLSKVADFLFQEYEEPVYSYSTLSR